MTDFEKTLLQKLEEKDKLILSVNGNHETNLFLCSIHNNGCERYAVVI